jgi:hypothetical protein
MPDAEEASLLHAVCYLVGAQACYKYSSQNEDLYEGVKRKLSLESWAESFRTLHR